MSNFDHTALVQNINQNLASLRKTHAAPLEAFTQLAKLAMAEGALSAKTKELMALAIGIT